MMIVHSHHIAGTWPIEKAKYTVTLPASERFLRLKKLKLDDGDLININFESVTQVRHNDGLYLDNDMWVKIQASKEKILNVECKSGTHLTLIAWHIGNRHCALQIIDNRNIRIENNNVISEMLVKLGANVRIGEDIFDPEPGAYGGH